MASVVDGCHAAWLACGCRGSLEGSDRHVVAVVAPAAVVGDQPGIGFGLELTERGEATAMEGGAPALLEDGARGSARPRRCGWAIGPGCAHGEPLGHHRRGEGAGVVLGTVVGEHGSDLDAVTPVVGHQAVEEAHRHGGVGGAHHESDKGRNG